MASQGLPESMNPASAQEKKDIEKMRKLIASDIKGMKCAKFPEISGQWNMLRFLRGFESDVDKASTAYKAMLKWRKENKVDEMRNRVIKKDWKAYFKHDSLPNAEKVLPYYPERFFHKQDKHGNPVMVTRQGFISDVEGLLASATKEEYWDFLVARGEARSLLLHALSEQRKALVKIVFIWDLDGMSTKTWKRINADDIKGLSQGYDEQTRDCYPEIAFKLLALRVPWFLTVIWKGVKHIVPKQTLAKVSVWGWKFPKITRYIDEDKLPVSLHGTCKCDGGCFPPMWMSQSLGRSGSETLTFPVDAGDKLTLTFKIDEGGYVDVHPFFLDDKSAKKSEIFGKVQYDSSEDRQLEFPVDKAGSILVKLGNGSRMWGTTFHYMGEVTSAAKEEEDKSVNTAELMKDLQVTEV